MKDLFFAVALFGIVMFAFFNIFSVFNIQFGEPPIFSQAYNSTYQKFQEINRRIHEDAQKMESGNLLERLMSSISLAFGLINYMIIGLTTIILSVPQFFLSFITYLSGMFGVDPRIVSILIGIVGVVAVYKAIVFLTGRTI